ncbi:uncharacterized protein LOC120209599 [Hibiscus syriacus]|uniref:uncharacterized protein LOC120209599 n=1 Tax=Hibiscus syriacus TaxID=106335 RepID=UPI001922A5AC|nr:uncharacterized protein LOC120209599 [Hibiscus syriacus]
MDRNTRLRGFCPSWLHVRKGADGDNRFRGVSDTIIVIQHRLDDDDVDEISTNTVDTETLALMYEADYSAMYMPEFMDMPNVGDYKFNSSVNDGKLYKVMEFPCKEEVMMEIKSYNIRNYVQSRVNRFTTEKRSGLRTGKQVSDVKNVTHSSISDVKSSRSEKKLRMEPDTENGNAEKEVCLETDSIREDVGLGTEQSSGSRRKEKRNDISSVDEKQSDSLVESEANPLMKDTISERDSSVRTPESPLNEQSALSETNPKSKMAKYGELEDLNAKDGEGNSLIDEKKVSFSCLESKMSVSLESGLKKKGESSGLEILESCSLGSRLKESQLNEQFAHSDSKQKREDVEIETKMEELVPSPLNLAVTKHNVTLTANAFPLNLAVTTDDVIPTAKVSEVTLGNSTAFAKDDVTLESNVSLLNLAVAEDDATPRANVKENNFSPTLHPSFQRNCISRPKKKLLVLDLNGILVDVVQIPCKLEPHAIVNGKGVFRRPFCDEFLDFCFMTFNVGIWSSRVHKNVTGVLDLLMNEEQRRELVFCYGRNLCTMTKFKTLENEDKPLVLKELRKLWDKQLPNIPWKKGEYDESNTLLLDDSPYKALRNPANTAIFPYPYQYTDAADCSLEPGGDLRIYLERLAEADNVQKFIEQNPFGQPAITEADPHWDFYSQIIENETLQARWSPRNQRSRSRSPRNRRSRSWSPRNRRSRSRSPGNQSNRSRSPGNQSSRSRSPGKQSSRSRSPRNRRSRSRFPGNRSSRSRSPGNQRSRSRSPRSLRSKSRSPRSLRSRSRSPRNRRSRSRSPHFKHTDEFSGENKRLVKGQMPFCFHFRRGKCYRGMSCRYLHHDSGKSYESRWERSKQQYLELPHTSRTNNACEEIRQSSEKREDSGDVGAHFQDNQSNEYHMVKSARSRDTPTSLFETHLLENKQETPNPFGYENCLRSRGRCPSFKCTDEFSGENKGQVKGQMPFCFDFSRGKCYRGVSCRYLHHYSGKSYESRWQRSKQQHLELPHASRTNNAREEIRQSSEKREDFGDVGVHFQDNQSNEYLMVKSDRSRGIPASLFETHLLENKLESPKPVSYENFQEAAAKSQNLSTIDSSSVGNMDTLKPCGNASQEVLISFSNPLDPVCQNANCQPPQSDNHV